MPRRSIRRLNPIAVLIRWSTFLNGFVSVAAGVLLASFRILFRFSVSHPTVPVHIKGLEDPVFCRLGSTDFPTVLQIWEDDEYRKATEYAEQPVHTVVDLGTNIGVSVGYFSTLWPEAKIVAVEPDPENFALARTNLASLENANRVVIENCFIGADPGFASPIRDSGMGENAVRMGPPVTDSQELSIPVRTMPQLLAAVGIERIDFLKCDIEGAELHLFKGGPEWIRSVEALVVELHGLEAKWLLEAVRDSGVRIERHEIHPVPGYDLTIVWAHLSSPNPNSHRRT